MDLDNDVNNTFESGIVLAGAGQAWDMSAMNVL